MTNEEGLTKEKSPQVAEIEPVLEQLVDLFGGENWHLTSDGWILAGEWALALQGWEIEGRPGHIDMYVVRDKLPWQTKEKYRTGVPPRDSPQFHDYIKFVEETKCGIDMFLSKRGKITTSELLKKDSVSYALPSGRKIRVQRPLSEVLDHFWMFEEFDEESVGKENLDRWWDYVRDIRVAAMKKKDKGVIEACEKLLRKHRKEF